jgi:hypothetical protein
VTTAAEPETHALVMTDDAIRGDLVVSRAPEMVLDEARRAAAALKHVIDNKARPVKFNGEPYLEFEDWQTPAEEIDRDEGTEARPVGNGRTSAASNTTPTAVSPATHGQLDTRIISEKQAARLFAISRETGWSDSELKEFLRREYQIDSTSQISRSQYNGIIDAIRAGRP